MKKSGTFREILQPLIVRLIYSRGFYLSSLSLINVGIILVFIFTDECCGVCIIHDIQDRVHSLGEEKTNRRASESLSACYYC